ncbi:MAG: hypothetical protein ACRDU0_11355, partial [Mycobacterium sp.]
MASPSEFFDFQVDDHGAVLERMEALAGEGSGWINLEPVMDGDVEPPPERSGLFGFLAALGPDLPLCTWIPGQQGDSGTGVVSVGVQHPAGPKVVKHLAEMGIAVPAGWVVRQDHPRRGLVLAVPGT